jgi:hypothetical protein
MLSSSSSSSSSSLEAPAAAEFDDEDDDDNDDDCGLTQAGLALGGMRAYTVWKQGVWQTLHLRPLSGKEPAMRERNRVRGALCVRAAALVAGLALVAAGGCSFWGSDGGGALEKDTAYRLYGRAPMKVANDATNKRVMENSFAAVPWTAVQTQAIGAMAGQATFRQSSYRHWGSALFFGWAPGESRILLDKGGDKTERLMSQSTSFLPGFPIAAFWIDLKDTWYSLDRGEELATRCYYGAGPAGLLAGYTRCVQPADIAKASGNLCLAGSESFGRDLTTVVAIKGEEARYNSQWAWQILGGAFGWGRVNYQYFLQVAWLPIPLWRVQE